MSQVLITARGCWDSVRLRSGRPAIRGSIHGRGKKLFESTRPSLEPTQSLTRQVLEAFSAGIKWEVCSWPLSPV